MRDLAPIALIAIAGFLLGGVLATWKNSKPGAVVLAVLAVLAAAGGIAWLI